MIYDNKNKTFFNKLHFYHDDNKRNNNQHKSWMNNIIVLIPTYVKERHYDQGQTNN